MTIINRNVFEQMRSNKSSTPFRREVSSASGRIENARIANVHIELGRQAFDIDVLVADLDPAISVLLGRDTYRFYPPFARHMRAIQKEIVSTSKLARRIRRIKKRKLDTVDEESELPQQPTANLVTLSDDESDQEVDDDTQAEHNSEEYLQLVDEIKTLLQDIAADEFKHLTPGSTLQHAIRLTDPHTKPFRQKMRKVPFSKRDEFYKLIKEQLDANIIAPSNSPWSSPVLLVAKPDGSIRLTIDYR